MSTTDASQIHDLRSALDFLREMPGQLLETDTQVDPDAEVSGVYRHVRAAGPLAPRGPQRPIHPYGSRYVKQKTVPLPHPNRHNIR